MANYQTLKSAIQQVVKQNGNNEITGALLQQSLLAMINSLGAGYKYMGVAIPTTNPGAPDPNVYYIATEVGEYTNFSTGSGNLSVLDGEVAIFKFNGTWNKETTGIASGANVNELKMQFGIQETKSITGGWIYLPFLDGAGVVRLRIKSPTINSIAFVNSKYSAAFSIEPNKENEIDIKGGNLSRILVGLASGVTTANVEISAYKSTYISNKISGINDKLQLQLSHNPETNYINKDNLIAGKYINATGGLSSSSNFRCSDFIEIESGIPYYFAYVLATYYAYYDSNKDFLVGYSTRGNITSPFVAPQGAKYIRVSFINYSYAANAWIYTENNEPSAYGEIVMARIVPGQIKEPMYDDNSISLRSIAFKEHNPFTNLIDKNKVSVGYVRADGTVNELNGFWATDFIPVDAGQTYFRGGTIYDIAFGIFNGYYAFYAEDKTTVIEGHNSDASLGASFEIPTGAKYARFTIVGNSNLQTAWLSKINRIPALYGYVSKDISAPVYDGEYCNYIGDEFSIFSKGVCIGDSLTDGAFNENNGSRLIIRKFSYPEQLSKLSGVICENWGYAGYTSKQWNDAYNDDEHDWSGFDFAIIQLGVNDALKNDGWTTESKTAFTNIVSRLKTDNKGIKIYIATIMPARNYRGTAIDSVSQGIRNFVAEMADDNVILLDMAIFAHTGESIAMNAGHLSAYGYWQLAKDYKAIIGYHIRTNPQLYKFVQFIGTNYEYSE